MKMPLDPISLEEARLRCTVCHGRRELCHEPRCPVILKYKSLLPVAKKIQNIPREFSSLSPPSIFVGRIGYPKVFVGPMLTLENETENVAFLDQPESWYGLSLEKIATLRALLTRTRTENAVNVNINNTQGIKIVEVSQEAALFEKPPEIETEIIKRPKLDLTFDKFSQPLGPISLVKKIQIGSEPAVLKPIEKLTEDTDVKAEIAVKELFESNIAITTIMRVFSVGLLGEQKNRKLVPTRWSITAVDDIIGKTLIKEIYDYPTISEIEVYHSLYLANNFYVVLIPRHWAFELLETWRPDLPNHRIGHDHEDLHPRTKYANSTAGAYYAARLAVLEHLKTRQRQATALVFREIYEQYFVPVGVWQVRENVRHALSRPPILKTTAIEAVWNYLSSRLKAPIKEYLHHSRIIPLLTKKQTKLTQFYTKET